MSRNVRRIHVAGDVLARLFETPLDARVVFAAYDALTKSVVLHVESTEFPALADDQTPPKMPAKLRLYQWTSEITRVSDKHCLVKIARAGELTVQEFHGDTAMQQAEIYHLAQRQRAGLL